MRTRVPGAFASLLAHDRDSPSCRATAATVTPASKAVTVSLRWQHIQRAARSRPGVPQLRNYGTPHICKLPAGRGSPQTSAPTAWSAPRQETAILTASRPGTRGNVVHSGHRPPVLGRIAFDNCKYARLGDNNGVPFAWRRVGGDLGARGKGISFFLSFSFY